MRTAYAPLTKFTFAGVEAIPYPRDLNIIWVCYKSGDVFTAPTTPTKARSLRVVEKGVSIAGISGGCFGSGPGRLKATTKLTYFDSSTLALGQVLYFKLFVEKGDRYASVSKTCTVVPAPPKYGIR
jgi:hypothetical protein